jgi:multidrug resistance efflux pump
MLALPAAAQTLPPGDAIGCACLKRSVDDARTDWTTRQGALDAANAELARLDNQLAAARAGLDVNNPQAVAQFRQLLAQRDSAAERSRGELVASAQAANARYNAAVGDYNGNCAGRPVPPPPPGPLTCPR